MKNIKGVAIATDGDGKRIAITFDVIDEGGKVTKSNNKTNRVIIDNTVLEAVKVVETYAKNIIESE